MEIWKLLCCLLNRRNAVCLANDPTTCASVAAYQFVQCVAPETLDIFVLVMLLHGIENHIYAIGPNQTLAR